jgi:N-acetyl-1-D-myo-inositol-2-amino-2-deoxy-alpha-D-glucopyranoside deacetylase
MSSPDRDLTHDIRPGDRWLVLVAHPDDETFGCGSLIAHAARRGAEVTVVCATRGEAGERTSAVPVEADLGTVRAAELHEAAAVLGAAHVQLLDYGDSGFDGDVPAGSLCGAAADEVTEVVAALLISVGPDVVVVLDGSDGHRDHLRMRACAQDAVRALGDPRVALVETCLPNHLMRRWLDEMRDAQPDAPYHAIDPASFGTPDDRVTDVLDLADELTVREAAIAVHRSQHSPFEDLSAELRRAFLADTHLARVVVDARPA